MGTILKRVTKITIWTIVSILSIIVIYFVSGKFLGTIEVEEETICKEPLITGSSYD